MIFSQTVEYALRAAVWLADHPEGQTTHEIAEATKVPPSYLSKVLQNLRRAGLVHGQRGVGGGFTLARLAGEISVLDVVQAVDPIERIATCPLGIPEHGANLCPLHRKLDDAIGHVAGAFGGTTLAELVAPRNPLKPLCPLGGSALSPLTARRRAP
jgi:Rrf2 family protein